MPNSEHRFNCQRQPDADRGTLLSSLRTGEHHLLLFPSKRASLSGMSASSVSLSLPAHVPK
jgi:hypothetical protein